MKKVLLSLTLVSSLFAATNCDKVLDKLDTQIEKVKSQKKPNPLRLEYLENQKNEISKNCVDGKIDSIKLKQIKADTKYDYESKKLKIKEDKLEAKKAKLNDDYKNEQDKIKAKQDKEEKKLIQKEQKAKKKAEKIENKDINNEVEQ